MCIESRAVTFFRILCLYLACSIVLLLSYTGQIGEANAYMGMQPWEMSVAGYISFAVGLPIVAWVASRTRGRPSDFFRLFYGTIAIISFLVLHPVIGPLPVTAIFVGLFLLVLPLLMLDVLDVILPSIKIKGVIGFARLESLIVLAAVVVVVVSAARSTGSSGFGLDDSHLRRLEGRDIYGAGTWLAYGQSMVMNGFSPYLAFRAGLRSRLYLLSFSVTAVCFFYWLVGVKAPLLYVLFSFVMGIFVRKGEIKRIGYYVLVAIAGLGLIVVVEWILFGGYSLVADYFFRRLFVVQAEVQGYYLKFLLSKKMVDWNWMYGSFEPDFAVTYYIGEHYLGDARSNANTNAFFYLLAAKGVIGYFIALLSVPLILVIFDRLYKSSRNPSYIFLGFLFGLLVVEQGFTVALVSSGVGALFVLTALEAGFVAGRAVYV